MEPTLEELQATWRGVLYAEPGTALNGHATNEFGWRGISVSRDGGKELLRVKLNGKKLCGRFSCRSFAVAPFRGVPYQSMPPALEQALGGKFVNS